MTTVLLACHVDMVGNKVCTLVFVGLQIVLRDQKSKEGFKYQSVEIYWSEQRAGLSLRPESYKEATTKSIFTGHL